MKQNECVDCGNVWGNTLFTSNYSDCPICGGHPIEEDEDQPN